MPVIPYNDHFPDIASGVFVAPTAWVTGKVTIEENGAVFFGASLRGDIQRIIVGEATNIQDNAVVHTSKGLGDCVIGPRVTVGHCAILHGCTIEGESIIGMGSTILDGAQIGKHSIIGAQALVTMNMVIPARSLVLGVPAKVVREITEIEVHEILDSARRYTKVAATYALSFSARTT